MAVILILGSVRACSCLLTSTHSYDHQAYGFTTELLYGESFENFTLPSKTGSRQPSKTLDATVESVHGLGDDANVSLYWFTPTGGNATLTLTQSDPFNGLQSFRLAAGNSIANRGFHGQGLSLAADKSYDFSVYTRSDAGATLQVQLKDFFQGTTLAHKDVTVPRSSGWSELKVVLGPLSASTKCRDYPWGTPPLYCYETLSARHGHACWQCGGQLVITAVDGTVDLDSASLQPGNWAKFKGQPIKTDIVTLLQKMHVDGIRLGGTYVKVGLRGVHNVNFVVRLLTSTRLMSNLVVSR